MGEAARTVPDDVKSRYYKIPWRLMIGLRNILIHHYFGIDESIVWEVIKKDLKEAKPQILHAIHEEGNVT